MQAGDVLFLDHVHQMGDVRQLLHAALGCAFDSIDKRGVGQVFGANRRNTCGE